MFANDKEQRKLTPCNSNAVVVPGLDGAMSTAEGEEGNVGIGAGRVVEISNSSSSMCTYDIAEEGSLQDRDFVEEVNGVVS